MSTDVLFFLRMSAKRAPERSEHARVKRARASEVSTRVRAQSARANLRSRSVISRGFYFRSRARFCVFLTSLSGPTYNFHARSRSFMIRFQPKRHTLRNTDCFAVYALDDHLRNLKVCEQTILTSTLTLSMARMKMAGLSVT